jgi:hypothetical protein
VYCVCCYVIIIAPILYVITTSALYVELLYAESTEDRNVSIGAEQVGLSIKE